MSIKLILAYPPSANHYLGRTKNGMSYLKQGAKDYHALVGYQILDQERDYKTIGYPMQMTVLAIPPDRRKRDNTNLEKVLKDSLERNGVYTNDNLVWDFRIKWDYYKDGNEFKYRIDPDKKGWVEVEISEIKADEKRLINEL